MLMKKRKAIIPSGKDLFDQMNFVTSKEYTYKPITQKEFRKFCIRLSGESTLNRRKALFQNRKNRWSKETREKYAAIKQVEWEEKQKELILKDEV